MNAQPISEKPLPSGCGRGGLFLFGFVFLLAGLTALYFAFLVPLGKSREARNWKAVDCIIRSAVVETRHDSDGDTTYAPQITYSYSFRGGNYQSSRYSFFDLASGRQWAQALVDRYPVGSQHSAYCDPQQPHEAVLTRELQGRNFWFGLLFPWPFILLGAGICAFTLRGKYWKTPSSRQGSLSSATPKIAPHAALSSHSPHRADHTEIGSAPDREEFQLNELEELSANASFEGPQKLRPAQSRLASAIGLGIFCLIWNGVLGFIAFSNRDEQLDAWSLVFFSPFLLAGIVLGVGWIYQLLALTNPTVEIALSNGVVALGESIDIAWQTFGRRQRIKEFVLAVEGWEEATYTRGTSTYTDKSRFCQIELRRTHDPQEMEFGTTQLTLPLDSMHSFQGGRNKIRWTIVVTGKIPAWPDLHEQFEFRVKPRGK